MRQLYMVVAHYIVIVCSVALTSVGCESPTGDASLRGRDANDSITPGNGASGAANASSSSGGVSASADGAGEPPGGSSETGSDLPLTGSGEATPGSEGTSEGTGGNERISPGTDGGVTPACPASTAVAPGETNRSVTVGAMNRTYLLHVPPGYDGSTPAPVVIDFHPLGGTGSSQRNLSGWGDLADREGFIVAWPNGIGNSWNVGRCCPPAANQQVDDVAFVRAIIAQLETEACIDSKRIYATGCSNGGGMSYKVACEAADVIAAIAPVDFDCVVGPANVPSCEGCVPARPISEIQFRATGDFAVNYEGGPAPIPQGMDFPGAEQNLSDWGEINECTGTPAPVADRPACEAFPMCASGAQTVLCTRQGGSHCGNYDSLDIVNVAWEMFQKASLP